MAGGRDGQCAGERGRNGARFDVSAFELSTAGGFNSAAPGRAAGLCAVWADKRGGSKILLGLRRSVVKRQGTGNKGTGTKNIGGAAEELRRLFLGLRGDVGGFGAELCSK